MTHSTTGIGIAGPVRQVADDTVASLVEAVIHEAIDDASVSPAERAGSQASTCITSATRLADFAWGLAASRTDLPRNHL